MERVIDIVKVVAPSIITGISTFLITSYKYNKNIPLDKLEKAYNKIYYPINCLTKSDMDISQIVKRCKRRLNKHRKYADRSTLMAFEYIKDKANLNIKDDEYINFINNIFNINIKLRRRLGYLEPTVFDMVRYSSSSEKRILRMLLEMLGIYVPAIIAPYVHDFFYNVVVAIFVVFFGIFVIELAILIIGLIWNGIKKIIIKLKKCYYCSGGQKWP